MSYRRRAACSLLALSLALGAAPALAQQNPPELLAVVGHDSGERITRSADVRRYFEALRTANPDRMVMGEMTDEDRQRAQDFQYDENAVMADDQPVMATN